MLSKCRNFVSVPPPCQFDADIAFLMDSFGTIDEKEFSQQKAFLKIMAKSFGNNTRSAVVTYGKKYSIEATFDDSLNISGFLKVVDHITKGKEGTDGRLDKAINLATLDVFPKTPPIVTKLAVVLTDGSQASGPNALELQQAFEASGKAGVRVLTIGIGKAVNAEEWRSIVERKEDFLQVENSQELTLKVHALAAKICSAAGKNMEKIS